jgi:hypothetical protein
VAPVCLAKELSLPLLGFTERPAKPPQVSPVSRTGHRSRWIVLRRWLVQLAVASTGGSDTGSWHVRPADTQRAMAAGQLPHTSG